MDKFAELQAFAAVVEHGGFSAGARELNQSRSTTNRLVIALEERLQVQLLNRSTRRVSITSEGEAFYERARRILDDLEEAEAAGVLEVGVELPHVLLEVKVPAEALVADLANVRLLLVVGVHVERQIVHL